MTDHRYVTVPKRNPYRIQARCDCGWESDAYLAGNSPLNAYKAAHQAGKNHRTEATHP